MLTLPVSHMIQARKPVQQTHQAGPSTIMAMGPLDIRGRMEHTHTTGRTAQPLHRTRMEQSNIPARWASIRRMTYRVTYSNLMTLRVTTSPKTRILEICTIRTPRVTGIQSRRMVANVGETLRAVEEV